MSDQEHREMDDEIDLKELIRTVLATKVYVLIALVGVSVLFWAFIMLKSLATQPIHSASARFDLVFAGAERREYPNGTAFSISDIIAPVVLNKVYDANNIEDLISRKEFVSAFSIEPHVPDREVIVSKYSDALSKKNLNQADLESLQSQLKQELSLAGKNSANLIFTSAKAPLLTDVLLKKVLRDIPSEWSQYMVKNRGVLKLDTTLYSKQIINEELYSSLDYLISSELLVDWLALIKENVTAIIQIPGGRIIRDEISGLSAVELSRRIEDLERYQILPLISPIQSLGIAKEPLIVQLYFQNILEDLLREKSLAAAKRLNSKEAYAAYVSQSPGITSMNGQESPRLNTAMMIPQIGAEFLDRIIEMTNAGSDIDYRQTMNKRQVDLADEEAEIDSDVNRVNQILINMKGNGNELSQKLIDLYTAKADSEFPAILNQLNDFFDISIRLYEKLSDEKLGYDRLLFRLKDGDLDSDVSGGEILNRINLKLYLIFGFLTVVLVVPLVMTRNALRKSQ